LKEETVFLLVTLLIGALIGVTVVAFVVLTERFVHKLEGIVALQDVPRLYGLASQKTDD